MSVPVVADQKEFTTHLRDADILLFDKLSSLNRLVQWADNRPVGHCAIWSSGGRLFEATRKQFNNETRGGVFDTSLEELLTETVDDGRGGTIGLVRTVTAVRYRGITEAQRRQVLEYAGRACGKEQFAVPEMVCLAPYAVRRSYAGDRRPAHEVMTGLMRVFQFYANACRPSAQQPRQPMFCSQLVYRSYLAAGLTIAIVDPLHAYYNKQLPRRGFHKSASGTYSARSADMGDSLLSELAESTLANEDAQLVEYSRTFEDVLLGPPAVLEGCVDEVSPTGDNKGRAVPRTLSDAIRGRNPGIEDMITPGDYWSSPSLEPVAALHRPPQL